MEELKYMFEIEGIDQIVYDLNVFGERGIIEVEPYVDKAGDILLNKTREKVPINTGALKKSLFLKRTRTRKVGYKNILTWGDDVRAYAAPLEFGHGLVYMGHPTLKFVKAKPFLRPAADESKEKVYQTITNGINKALDTLRK
jgi:HK97 gp10 family phage protein